MASFFMKIAAFFSAILVWFGAVFNQTKIEPVFSETNEKTKVVFDEGDFVMGEYDIIVSPDGNDDNDGTLENPLKTIEAAKEKAKTVEGSEAITIWFREGTYHIAETISFTAEDRANVLYRSYPDEKVEFSGAKEISGFSETTINGVRAFAVDIPIENEEDYFRSLFKGDKRLTRPEYPKEGTLKIADPSLSEGIPSDFNVEFFTHSAAFYAHTSDVMDFVNTGDVEVKIMHYWCDEHLPIHSVDTATGRIETTKPTAMTLRVDDNYIFENVKEALTLPGEWYLDRAEQKLYYIPENGDTLENTVLYAGVTKQIFAFEKAENISFQGIDFINTDWEPEGKYSSFFGKMFDESHPLYKNLEYGAVHPQAAFEVPAAINVSASTGINFTDCRFENISYTAIKFENASKNCNVTTCMFENIGGNAVFIHGDFVVPASTQNINVTDCHIGYYGRIFNNAIGILLTHAIDCNLSNNEIHDGWYTGISVGWNWGYSDNPTNNINISNNLIYNIGNGWLSDMGGIYTLGIQPDTVISGNVIYNVGCDEGEYGYGGWGVYLDEGSSGILVENNLVYDCSSQLFHQHYGEDNMIRNNIFAFGGEGQFRITRHEDHNSLFLENNILIGKGTAMYSETTDMDWFIDNGNTYWDYKNGGNVYSGRKANLFSGIGIPAMVGKGYYNNAVFADPLFKDAENRDFTLATNSPAVANGFVPFEYNAGTITLFE